MISITNNVPQFEANSSQAQKLVPNQGHSSTVSKVVAAVTDFFQAIYLRASEAALWVRDCVIDFLPEQTALRLDPRREFVRTIRNIPADERGDVLGKALPYIRLEMNGDGINQLIEPMNNANFTPRKILGFITRDMCSLDNLQTIKVIADIPNDQRNNVVNYSNQLISEQMDGQTRRTVIQSVAAIPPQQRAAFVEFVAAIPAEQRAEFAARARQLIKPEMNADLVRRIYLAVGAVPADERNALTALAMRLITQDMTAQLREAIILDLAAVPALEREGVVKNTLLLIKPEEGVYNKWLMLKSVIDICLNEKDGVIRPDERGERDDVTALAMRFITQDMTSSSIRAIVQFLSYVPAPERNKAFENVLLLINSTMNSSDRVAMIFFVASEIPANKREAVTGYATAVVTSGMELNSILEILKAMVHVTNWEPGTVELDNVMWYALQLIKDEMNASEKAQIIRYVPTVPENLRASYIKWCIENSGRQHTVHVVESSDSLPESWDEEQPTSS